MHPEVGTPAPSFVAPDANGNDVSLTQFRGKHIVVLYFYPKDNTSGCTKEACGFRDNHEQFAKLGVQVMGVSPDSSALHAKFSTKNALPFILVADEDRQICEAYGVWQEKSMYGKKYMGVARTTFVIDKKGRIAHVFEKVKAAGHDEEVLAWIRENLAEGRK
jgi:thioredoxin-dependent peroxiredoxin